MAVTLKEERLGALRWIVLGGPGTEAFRGAEAIAIPLAGLARGRAGAQQTVAMPGVSVIP